MLLSAAKIITAPVLIVSDNFKLVEIQYASEKKKKKKGRFLFKIRLHTVLFLS